MKLEYKRLIETGFDIINKSGQRVPFTLNPVQIKYLQQMESDYPDLQGVRDNILKARQEGFSALVDAILTVDFLTQPNIGGQIISHKKEETELLMNRVNFFIDSFCDKRRIHRKALLEIDSNDYLVNKLNGSYLFIGTAGARTLGRGGTLQNIHWSEVGFYPDTVIMSAERLVTGAEQQVATGVGKIFRESTGNRVGDFFNKEVNRSRKGESNFKYRFYAWFENPEYRITGQTFNPTAEEIEMMQRYHLTAEQMLWYRAKSKEFETRSLFVREYPTTPEDAFLTSGSAFFDPDTLKFYYDARRAPIREGALAFDGNFL